MRPRRVTGQAGEPRGGRTGTGAGEVIRRQRACACVGGGGSVVGAYHAVPGPLFFSIYLWFEQEHGAGFSAPTRLPLPKFPADDQEYMSPRFNNALVGLPPQDFQAGVGAKGVFHNTIQREGSSRTTRK